MGSGEEIQGKKKKQRWCNLGRHFLFLCRFVIFIQMKSGAQGRRTWADPAIDVDSPQEVGRKGRVPVKKSNNINFGCPTCCLLPGAYQLLAKLSRVVWHVSPPKHQSQLFPLFFFFLESYINFTSCQLVLFFFFYFQLIHESYPMILFPQVF